MGTHNPYKALMLLVLALSQLGRHVWCFT